MWFLRFKEIFHANIFAIKSDKNLLEPNKKKGVKISYFGWYLIVAVLIIAVLSKFCASNASVYWPHIVCK